MTSFRLRPQHGDDRGRLPVAAGRVTVESFTARTAPVAAQQIGGHPTFVEEHVLPHVTERQPLAPTAPLGDDIRPSLFVGVYRFFDGQLPGAVVLVRFPFSDLSKSKLRPAVVLADAGRGDRVLCQITSKPYGDARAVQLEQLAFASGITARDELCPARQTLHYSLPARSSNG